MLTRVSKIVKIKKKKKAIVELTDDAGANVNWETTSQALDVPTPS